MPAIACSARRSTESASAQGEPQPRQRHQQQRQPGQRGAPEAADRITAMARQAGGVQQPTEQQGATERPHRWRRQPAQLEQGQQDQRQRHVFDEVAVHADPARQQLVAAIAQADLVRMPVPHDRHRQRQQQQGVQRGEQQGDLRHRQGSGDKR